MDIGALISTAETVFADVKVGVLDSMVIAKAIPGIHADVKAGKSVMEIAEGLKPEVINVLSSIAQFLPAPLNTIASVVLFVIAKSQPLVPGSVEETNYFNKATGEMTDGAGNRADSW